MTPLRIEQPGPYGHLQGSTLIAAGWLCGGVLRYLLNRRIYGLVRPRYPFAEYVEVELDDDEDVGPRLITLRDKNHNRLVALEYNDFWEDDGADKPIYRIFSEINDMRSELWRYYGTQFVIEMTYKRPIHDLVSVDDAAQLLGQLANAPLWKE